MMPVIRIPDEICNEFRVDSTGKVFLSIERVSRLAGVYFTEVFRSDNRLSQALSDKGFEPSTFSLTWVPNTALSIILRYYGKVLDRPIELGEINQLQQKGQKAHISF
jgi:hypothetical protein